MDTTNLNTGDQQPIYPPGYIQPHGILLVLTDNLLILQVSNNTTQWLGTLPANLLNQPLTMLFDDTQLILLRETLSLDDDLNLVNPLNLSLQVNNQTIYFDGIIHRQIPTNLQGLQDLEGLPPLILG